MDTMNRVLADLKNCIISYGQYTFLDKGPHEVFPIDTYCKEFAKLPPEQVGEFLEDLNKMEPRCGCCSSHACDVISNKFCRELASAFLNCLDEQPEEWFNKLCESTPSIEY